MELLPRWVLTNQKPALYDSESGTAIEQTARVYNAVNELIENYNEFISTTNNAIDTFKTYVNNGNDVFSTGLRQEFQDFINVIDLKAQENTNYMRANLQETANNYLSEIITQLRHDMETFASERDTFNEQFANQTATINQQNRVLSAMLQTVTSTLEEQNGTIETAKNYMETNIATSVNSAVEELINNGDIVIGTVYDTNTEALSFSATNINNPIDLVVTYDGTTESINITGQ